MLGCVVVQEDTARWRSLNFSAKEKVAEEARRRAWREQWEQKSWVGRKLSEMMRELSYVGYGARIMVFVGLALVGVAVL